MPNPNTWLQFLPELIVGAGAVAILTIDLIVPDRRDLPARLAALTLLLAILATFLLYGFGPGPTLVGASTPAVACPSQALFEVRAPSASGQPGAIVRCGPFVADRFTQFFRLFGQTTALLVVLSGAAFMRRRSPHVAEFHAILLFAVLAMSLMAGASDLVLIALSIEFLSLSSYVLTAFLRGDALSTEAGLKYFLYGAVTSAVMLFGLSLLFGTAGSTSVPAIAVALRAPEALASGQGSLAAVAALALVTVGLAFKIALVPFHQWSPDAYEGAATPVTAFLSVGPKLAGYAVLVRLLMTVFPTTAYAPVWLAMLAFLAVVTMVVGNVVALVQDNVKRMMAYSSIAQAGFMLIGLAAWSPGDRGTDALAAVLIYLLAYVFANLGAFAVIVAVHDATDSADIAAYSGLMRRSPLLAGALAVFFLSLVGIPPLAGFIGKFAVFRAAVVGDHLALALVGVLTGVISVGYYFRVLRHAFLRPPVEGAGPIRLSPAVRAVIVSTLMMTLLVGLYAGPFIAFATHAASAMTPSVLPLAGGG